MLRNVSEIIGYRIATTDSEIGKAYDFLFDDDQWTVRHLVVDTGRWLPGRKVLIAPEALGEADWEAHLLRVALTKEKIENSPSMEADMPVSRQQELELFRYYAWTPYWGGSTGMLRSYPEPAGLVVPEQPGDIAQEGDPHLRSVKEVMGYHILAADGEIGHIDDFIVDDDTWIIRYAVVDTRNWLPGRKVLVSPWWLKDINWAERNAATDLTQDDIKNSPPFNPSAPINPEYEKRLYDYYGRPAYWQKGE